MLEVTSGCDGSTSRSYGLSLYGVGLGLNTNDLPGFTSGKYVSVLNTIQGQITAGALSDAVPPSLLPPNGNFTYSLRQCVSTSQAAFAKDPAYYVGAANQVLTADQNIAAVAMLAPATGPFNPVSAYPNPSGALRSRLENIYYTINTRIKLNPAASVPPSPAPAPPPPSISGTPALTAKAGSAYAFQPSAADFAGNTGTLSFSISGRPSWATFSTTTGKLSGIPVKGTYPGIVISVTDGCASASLPAFQIRVN